MLQRYLRARRVRLRHTADTHPSSDHYYAAG